MRIAIGGIEHESSNYSPVQTPLEAFYGHSRSSGTGELLQRSGEVNTIIDGFIRELRRQEVEMVPLVWRHAPSGAQPTRETHQAMKETLLAPLRQALPVDGVLLSLHGAYSAQGHRRRRRGHSAECPATGGPRLSGHCGPRSPLQHRQDHGGQRHRLDRGGHLSPRRHGRTGHGSRPHDGADGTGRDPSHSGLAPHPSFLGGGQDDQRRGAHEPGHRLACTIWRNSPGC